MANVFSLQSLKALLAQRVAQNFAAVHHLRFIYIACALGALYTILEVGKLARRRLKTTALRGPPSPSFVCGVDGEFLSSRDAGTQHEKWAEEYGGVYEVPSALGGRTIILCDPKAIAHVYGGKTYILMPFAKIAGEIITGEGILTANGDTHRRQRKTLIPAFSNAAIRNLTSVFYDSAYKTKIIWDSLIDTSSNGSTVIEVQNWMNHISLDTIGIAGFSHDFGSLDGKLASVAEVFDAFGDADKNADMSIIALAMTFPWLLKIPTPFSVKRKKLNDAMSGIVDELLTKTREEKEKGTLGEREEISILGLLIKAENQSNHLRLTREEVIAQAKVLLVAGYETTSITLTWALIELSKNPDIQTKLRAELLEFGTDPTYDQLFNTLPYLDAVVHETLRMHAPLTESYRVATEDDAIPLSKPVHTRSGKLVDHISVAKGTHLLISIASINRSTVLWGPDAKEFNPERWIVQDAIPAAAREVQGHRHLLTFIDGPKTCLGKGFAIAELKLVLSVLVKSFVFELRDGPETAIEMTPGILWRPKVTGEQGTAVPLRVRRFE